MASVLYRQGRKQVVDILTGVSKVTFGQFLEEIEKSIPARLKRGQPADLIKGIQDTVNHIRCELAKEAAAAIKKVIEE